MKITYLLKLIGEIPKKGSKSILDNLLSSHIIDFLEHIKFKDLFHLIKLKITTLIILLIKI